MDSLSEESGIVKGGVLTFSSEEKVRTSRNPTCPHRSMQGGRETLAEGKILANPGDSVCGKGGTAGESIAD
jgi:hypothetical protein